MSKVAPAPAPATGATATVRVSNIPSSAVAAELLAFFDTAVAAAGAAFACEIAAAHRGWLSRGHGSVQFDSAAAASLATDLSSSGRLPPFLGSRLSVSPAHVDLLPRAPDLSLRAAGASLVLGNCVAERELEVAYAWDGVRAEVIPGKRRVDLYLEQDSRRYKLEVLFEDIRECFGCSLDGTGAILLQLIYAPRIHTAISGSAVNSRFTDERFHACKEDAKFAWVRALDFTPNSCFGKCSTLVLKLGEGAPVSDILESLSFSGELGELAISSMDVFGPSSKVVPLVDCPSGFSVPYEILFRLNSLVHMGKLVARHVNADLFKVLEELSVDTSRRIFEKMSKLKSTCYEPLQFIRQEAHSMKISKNALLSNKSKGKGKLTRCYRVHITPSKIYCLGPEEEVSNYVVKYHFEYASDFVRVTFVDEDWSKLSPNALSARIEQGFLSTPLKTGLYHRILSILKEGFCIGPKKYEFLAFSASQLRGNSVWMFASNNSLTAECIRKWMGHFKDIRSVSKCAARMGQLFSSSRQTFEVSSYDVEVIPDIEVTTDGTKYIFSDGIGKVSLRFARQIATIIGLDPVNPPSAFQIRYGGYKGVIAVDPTSFFDLSLRPSMKKFESKSTMLNITNWSKSQPCYMNREIISLLSTLGIRDEIFVSMQKDDMHESDDMLTNKEAALSVLGKIGGAETKTAVKMLLQGYEPSSEPYLLMILKAHQANRLTDIRTRCKIHVQKGRVLIGCLDETGKLDYGQVYIRITKNRKEQKDNEQPFFYNDDGKTAVVVGKVAISKNPCLHPGDIRVLEAVYDPGLDARGLVDCVVFPQRGERPHPNECSGGDLDGDLFFITWDDKLIPEKIDAPMDYTATRPRIMDHVVTLEEIQKHFVDYMINDALGVISTAHLIHADRDLLKARSPECLQLAALHSMAVDFAKTGAPAEMPRALRPREFPDFMERWEKPMYISNGVLGKLYRAALQQAENSEALLPPVPPSCAYDPDLEISGFHEFLDAAEECYELYAEKLGTLMSYYSAEREDEILTGNIGNKLLYLKRDNKRYFEMKDRIVAAVDSLHDEVRGWLRGCREEDASRVASAWYHVTYHPDRRQGKRFWSFPWIVCDSLLAIKAARRCRRQVDGAVPMDCGAHCASEANN
ncbi:probable RNA-dependent RNA polymerase 2 [Phragmites australis]|uniref:probable RNA-dependent RNA polymerase 2 n=1 Tax=Phragmites australis TaxID=29695 RepID=UPI002D78EEA4|nr:probable RNA-dependent RNA polymerase 2 [Phragmites australis]